MISGMEVLVQWGRLSYIYNDNDVDEWSVEIDPKAQSNFAISLLALPYR